MTDPSLFDQSLLPPALRQVSFEDLAAQFGTPLFVYDETFLRQRCREYIEHFGEGNVAYAGKAFLCRAMVNLIRDEGLLLDVADGELQFAGTGFPPERMILHGNNKTTAEIKLASEMHVARVVADSFDELDRLADVGFAGEVFIRVTPGVEARTHEYIKTGAENSKFGFSVSTGLAAKAVRRVEEAGLLFGGLHCHIGSQILELDSYARAVAVVSSLADSLERETHIDVHTLNLGGGLGVRYLSSDREVSVAEYASVLRAGANGRRIMVEPGRSIAAQAAVTVYRVGTIKDIPGVTRYIAVDGGMSDNPRPAFYGARYEAFVPARANDPRTLVASIAGKHCEQGDLLVIDALLPEATAVGDLLVTPVTGAYGYSMASNYNKVARPAVVFVGDEGARLVVRRESPEDLRRLDVVDA